jgi:hypothetical protein
MRLRASASSRSQCWDARLHPPPSFSSRPRASHMPGRRSTSGRDTRSAFSVARSLNPGRVQAQRQSSDIIGDRGSSEAITLLGRAGINRGEPIVFLASTLFMAPVYRTHGSISWRESSCRRVVRFRRDTRIPTSRSWRPRVCAFGSGWRIGCAPALEASRATWRLTRRVTSDAGGP